MSTILNKISVKTDLVGCEPFPFEEGDTMQHNKYKVTIRYNGKQTSFPFWDSKHNTDMGIEPDKDGLLETVYSDFNYADYSFEDFVMEFGYDADSRKAEKIWKNCVKQSLKLRKVFSNTEIEEVREALDF